MAEGLIVFDVDGTLTDGNVPAKCEARPGVKLLVDLLARLGFRLAAWSANGEEHARAAVEAAGLQESVTAFFGKPDYPIAEAPALAVLGEVPVMTVDDDASENVADWPFFFVDGWYGW